MIRTAGMIALLLVAGCGSDDEATSGKAPPVAAATPTANAKAAAAAAFKTYPTPPFTFVDSLGAPPALSPPPDPDAVVDSFDAQCTSGTSSAECDRLRSQVEVVFLGDLLALRAANAPIDRQWYRTAAAAQLPRLACIGLNEIRANRTPEDDALFDAAADSPYRSPRRVALWSGTDFVQQLQSTGRLGADRGVPDEFCLDPWRDVDPHASAPLYPDARYRYFASDASRSWYTTNDSPDQVVAYLTKAGATAYTAQGLTDAILAVAQDEMMRASVSGDSEQMMKVMREMASAPGGDFWTRPFAQLGGIGEIRYVMRSRSDVVAVFGDEVLGATSLVAVQPPSGSFDPTDIEQIQRVAERAQLASRIFGH